MKKIISSSFGKNIKVTISGGSHEKSMHLEMQGLSFEEASSVDLSLIREALFQRSPQAFSDWPGVTGRRETDDFKIISHTPLCIEILNSEQRSEDYSLNSSADIRLLRPGHADLTAFLKYGDSVNMSGGGPFSARMTACVAIAGNIAMQVLRKRGFDCRAETWIKSIGGFTADLADEDNSYSNSAANDNSKLKKLLASVSAEGDSIGSVIGFKIDNPPQLFGGPLFDGTESVLSPLLFAIPGVKALSFGNGIAASDMKGSQNNDAFTLTEAKETESAIPHLATNNCGGILGGITTGSPLTGEVFFKPTPSIRKEQGYFDVVTGRIIKTSISGRHDVCIGIRGQRVVESMLYIGMLELVSEAAGLPEYESDLPAESETKNATLASLRRSIDQIDYKVAELLNTRLLICQKAGRLKQQNGLFIYDRRRESEVLNNIKKSSCNTTEKSLLSIYDKIFEESRSIQKAEKKAEIGLIGKSLKHSYSKLIFSILGSNYELFEKKEDELPNFLSSPSWKGLNITLPYKQKVIKSCNLLTDAASSTGAVNCIYKREGKIVGDNTDLEGFMGMLNLNQVSLKSKKILIIGNGGAAKTVKHACSLMKARSIVHIGRSGLRQEDMDGEILINCTPCGMYPDVDDCPVDISLLKNCELVVDLIYNPLRSNLILEANTRNIRTINGLSMLVLQATASYRKFFDNAALPYNPEDLTRELEKRVENIILIGMPGSGKSAIGRLLSKIMCRPLLDTDSLIEEETSLSISKIFEACGEEFFRQKELSHACSSCKHSGHIIVLGGGAVESEKIMIAAKRNGKIFFVDRNPKSLATSGRPLSKSPESVKALYEKRISLYNNWKDFHVSNNSNLDAAASRIAELFNSRHDCER